MGTTTRLRRGGVLGMAALAAVALSACADGFFFDPAPVGLTPVSVQVAWVGGTEGPQAAGAAGAFDKADGAQVVVTAADRQLFNQRVALETVGSDRKITLSLELPAGSVVQASVQVTLLQGTTQLFTGAGNASLTPGQAAEVTVGLNGVVAAVAVSAPAPVLRLVGGTVQLVTLGLFSTGDTLGAVSATYRALGTAVSVSSTGTVTAVANGTAGVEATYQGKADTVTITVEDRCLAPFASLGLGQTANGTLEADDCADAGNFAYNDWYQVVLTQASLVRATLTSSSVEPFVGLSTTSKYTLAVAASQTGSVTSEYLLPPGTYLLRAGSRARSAGPVPTGGYALALTGGVFDSGSEPQAGCFASGTSPGATWIVAATAVGGRLAADDCAPWPGARHDLYGGRLSAGDTALVTVDANFPLAVSYQGNSRRTPSPAGGRVQWAFTSDAELSHYVSLWTDAAGPFGQYLIQVQEGLTPDWDPCVNPPMEVSLNAADAVATGRLQKRIDCQAGDRLRDSYALVPTPSEAFQTTLESTDFDPFVVVAQGSRTGWGRSGTGSVTAEHLYPTTRAYQVRALARDLVSSGGRVEGAYTVRGRTVAEPQVGCISTAFVDFGSAAQGHITLDDCEDEFDGEPEVVRRWDGYTILLQPGETVTVSLVGDFPLTFTRWTGGEFAEGRFGIAPGVTEVITFTQPLGGPAAFHSFYAISAEHNGTGGYDMSFSGNPNPPPAAVGAAASPGPGETLRFVDPPGGTGGRAR